jgi:hypothetical protein
MATAALQSTALDVIVTPGLAFDAVGHLQPSSSSGVLAGL